MVRHSDLYSAGDSRLQPESLPSNTVSNDSEVAIDGSDNGQVHFFKSFAHEQYS